MLLSLTNTRHADRNITAWWIGTMLLSLPNTRHADRNRSAWWIGSMLLSLTNTRHADRNTALFSNRTAVLKDLVGIIIHVVSRALYVCRTLLNHGKL